ncbi:hypothetical protein QQF64_034170 [Cirrhinus molitorella]|uniref:Uncharacterized protein n=1 Tax=Cirrhinus molitorella TaxID=172907 RepID=A0ABR3MW11_9TELE
MRARPRAMTSPPPPPPVFEISTWNRFAPLRETERDAVIVGDSIVRSRNPEGRERRRDRPARGLVERHQAAADGGLEAGLRQPDRDGSQHGARDEDQSCQYRFPRIDVGTKATQFLQLPLLSRIIRPHQQVLRQESGQYLSLRQTLSNSIASSSRRENKVDLYDLFITPYKPRTPLARHRHLPAQDLAHCERSGRSSRPSTSPGRIPVLTAAKPDSLPASTQPFTVALSASNTVC